MPLSASSIQNHDLVAFEPPPPTTTDYQTTTTNNVGNASDFVRRCYSHWSEDVSLYDMLVAINLWTLLPVVIVGLLTNAAALYLLWRPPKIQSGVFVYLNALLIVNILQLICIGTRSIPYVCDAALSTPTQQQQQQRLSHNNVSRRPVSQPMCFFYHRFLLHLAPRLLALINTVHVWVITALSVHRAWKMACPLVSRATDTRCRAYVTLAVVVAIAIAFRLPLFAEIQVLHQSNTWMIVERHRLARHRRYNVFYHVVATSVYAHICPFVLTVVSCLYTIAVMHRQQRRWLHRNAQSGAAKRARATGSIVAIVLAHTVLHTLSLYEMITRGQGILLDNICFARIDFLLPECAVLLTALSAATNAFIFIAFTNGVKAYLNDLRQASRRQSSNSSGQHSYSHHHQQSHCFLHRLTSPSMAAAARFFGPDAIRATAIVDPFNPAESPTSATGLGNESPLLVPPAPDTALKALTRARTLGRMNNKQLIARAGLHVAHASCTCGQCNTFL